MMRRHIFFLTLYLFLKSLNLPALTSDELELRTDFNQFIQEVIKNNLELKTQMLATEENLYQYKSSFGEFDYSLNTNFIFDRQNTPISTTLDTQGSVKSVINETTTTSLTLKRPTMLGPTLQLPYTYSIVDSTSTFRTIKKTHEPKIGFGVNYALTPLLKNGYFTRQISWAFDQYLEKNALLQQQANDLLFSAIERWNNYFEQLLQLKKNKEGLKVAQNNFQFVLKKYSLGQVSLIEKMEAEGILMKKEELILQNQTQIQSQIKELNLLTNNSSSSVSSVNALEGLKIPQAPEIKNIEQNYSAYYQKALKNRGDYLQSEHRLSLNKSKMEMSQIDDLPKLVSDANAHSRTIRSEGTRAHQDLKDAKFVQQKYSLQIQWNIMGYAEKGAYQVNRLKYEQEKLKNSQLKKQIEQEIKLAIEGLLTQKKIVQLLEKAVLAEEQKMEFYTKKFYHGAIDSFEWSKHMENKTQAENELIKSQLKLNLTHYKLLASQGVLAAELGVAPINQ